MKHRQTTRRRSMLARRLSWLVAAGIATAALITPSAALAAGPGNNGLDATGNGTKSNATVNGSLSGAGNSATMDGSQGGSTLTCDGNSAGKSTGSFTLTNTLDVGSKITVYLVPNGGSNATPEANVAKNETTITLTASNNTSGSVINWSITVTSPFTVSSGGILGVFAVNDDGVTAISSSKTFSLNCTESTPSDPPSAPPSEAPSAPPSALPSEAPSGSVAPTGGVEAETDTPTGPPTDTLASTSTDAGGALPLLLLVLGVIGIGALVLTPKRNRR